METYTTIVRFFQEGGFFMYPIALVMAVGIAVAIERYLYLSRERFTNRRMWEQLSPVLQSGKYQQAAAATGKSNVAIAKILNYGLGRLRSARRREDIEMAMDEGLMEVIPRLERRTQYLAAFANISTLLGLLGTIIGLIQAFTAVANANPAEKAELLSQSIAVAMNTTAFGLIVAIPLLLVHSVLQSKTGQVVDSLEMAAVKFLNMVGDKREAPAS
ncbi:MAG: flagellar motor protein MotA [Candidatus Muproteobacteria bacterium RBG_16_60_9]|uniref:Flagellar motor protein MotA n=1 Tax=Candidatus Muproteobacteria bacterium RBG_16_60_9 TaxID=1817755 RepID=A0A1F6UW49_9PROT|nr:MAG: flagellar motor protein MotA [Candidatus Muproteobacteria bacterium RBG_16_60_9]